MKPFYVCTFSALLACAATAASAANLIVNGTFDANVDGWSVGASATSIWFDSSQDADGSNTSGSMAMSTSNGSNANLSVSQCITALDGTSYSFGLKVLPNTSNTFGMTCSAFAEADCGGASIGDASINGPMGGKGWVTVQSDTPFVVPSGTLSVSCSITSTQPLRQAKSASQPNGFAPAIYVDDVVFASTDPVTLQSFDVD
jgi:hypothetical protein